ncbi:hypothetical protein ACFFX1_55370 [Dactylosporangium sucinum]|uniref:Uncharacterized protein n=1 Tax=Dactylosporangium sucinum TaxID=1424081 RepID=A0A917U3P5_9ACTN|nr:hypothetical protein [Dactylosporangium sucinum]GGM52754.1 hypothetical protein GCM10007977_062900 [Dactylosporangium sucinum]
MSAAIFARQVLDAIADPWGLRRAETEQIRAAERERIAAYLDRAAASQRKTGLLGDEVSANALAEAAEWCREPSIWTETDR